MESLNILVTGGGSPGIAGTLYSLRNHNVITCDMNGGVIGQYMGKFYRVPPASHPDYSQAIYDICDKEDIDVILPQNTAELNLWYYTHNKYPVAVAGWNIPKNEVADGVMVHNFEELTDFARDHDKFVVKPPDGNGSRGVRIVTDEQPDYYRKPGIPVIQWRHLYRELGESFELFAQPYYEGTEVTVDCFRGKDFTAIPRVRDSIRSGISFSGRVVKDMDLIEKSRLLAEKFDLKYAFGFQFIDGKVIECNPRVQGTMVVSTLAGANMIEAACYAALGVDYPPFNIDWESKFIRYWGLIAENGTGLTKI